MLHKPAEIRTGTLQQTLCIASHSHHRFALPSSERDRPAVAVAAAVKRDKRSMSASSEESMGSWSHMTPEDDPHEETSSFIQLSEGSVTIAPCSKCCRLPPSPHAHWPIATDTSELIYTPLLQHLHSLKWCVSLDSLHIAMLCSPCTPDSLK